MKSRNYRADDEVHEMLRKLARMNGRTMQGQLAILIREAYASQPRVEIIGKPRKAV